MFLKNSEENITEFLIAITDPNKKKNLLRILMFYL